MGSRFLEPFVPVNGGGGGFGGNNQQDFGVNVFQPDVVDVFDHGVNEAVYDIMELDKTT